MLKLKLVRTLFRLRYTTLHHLTYILYLCYSIDIIQIHNIERDTFKG